MQDDRGAAGRAAAGDTGSAEARQGPSGPSEGGPPGATAAGEDGAGANPPTPSFAVRDRRFWAQGSNDQDDGPGRASKPSYVEELEAKLAAAEAKTTETLAQYQAARDEFEAARARLRRDQAREVEAGKRSFVVDLLEVVDNLERALAAARAGGAAAAAGGLLSGVEMVHQLFVAKLGQLGVRAMASMGARFDARHHEALATVPVARPADDGLVQGIIREGYTLGDETLRFAQVAVGRVAAAGDGDAGREDGDPADARREDGNAA